MPPKAAAKVPIEIREPALNVPVLEHWAGVYDHVFFALNPPCRVPWTDAVPEEFKVTEDGKDYLKPFSGLWDVDGIDLDKLIRDTGEASTWAAEHVRLAPNVPFPTFAKAYWIAAVMGFPKESDPRVVKALKGDRNSSWFMPSENELPPIMAEQIGKFFGKMGCAEIHAYSEFRDSDPKQFTPNELMRPETELTLQVGGRPWRIGCLHAPFPGAVMIWSFDEAYTTIGLTEAAFSRANPEDFFECFRATPDMQRDWLRQLEKQDAAR